MTLGKYSLDVWLTTQLQSTFGGELEKNKKKQDKAMLWEP
jgi:hypothetical protein